MAGPVLTCYIRPQLTSELAHEIGDWLRDRIALENGYPLTETWNGPFPARADATPQKWPSWDFQAAVDFPRQAQPENRRPILFGLAPFGGEAGADYCMPQGWFDFASTNLGYTPGFFAQVSCMSKQPEDHRVGAQIALAIVEWLGGTIELDIEFPAAKLQTIKGNYRFVSGAYQDPRYGWNFCELGLADADFLRDYLDQPGFYLRK